MVNNQVRCGITILFIIPPTATATANPALLQNTKKFIITDRHPVRAMTINLIAIAAPVIMAIGDTINNICKVSGTLIWSNLFYFEVPAPYSEIKW
jgi:hypothetical protein